MKYNTQDPEYILLHKEYNALTLREQEIIKEEIQNEEEFNRCKALLQLMEQEDEEIVVPSASIQAQLLKEFSQSTSTQPVAIKAMWKWSAVAAVLVIGLVLSLVVQTQNNNSEYAPKQIAELQQQSHEEEVFIPQVLLENKKEVKDIETSVEKTKELTRYAEPVLTKVRIPQEEMMAEVSEVEAESTVYQPNVYSVSLASNLDLVQLLYTAM